MNRSTYTTTTLPGFICLTDSNQPGVMSLTNDAENVIADLVRDGYDLKVNRVLYCDSQGVWDELVVRRGKFAGFQTLNADDLDEAIKVARACGRFRDPPSILGTGMVEESEGNERPG